MIVYLPEPIGAVLPLFSLQRLYVLLLSLIALLDDGLVPEGTSQVFLSLPVSFPLLPCHIDELLLVREHVFLVILLDL